MAINTTEGFTLAGGLFFLVLLPAYGAFTFNFVSSSQLHLYSLYFGIAMAPIFGPVYLKWHQKSYWSRTRSILTHFVVLPIGVVAVGWISSMNTIGWAAHEMITERVDKEVTVIGFCKPYRFRFVLRECYRDLRVIESETLHKFSIAVAKDRLPYFEKGQQLILTGYSSTLGFRMVDYKVNN